MSSVILVTTIFVIVHRLADGLSLPADQFISSASIEFKGTSDTLDNQVQSRQKSCWELMVDGRRLHPQFIVRSVYAATLLDCQRECEDVLFNCETIAYGHNSIKNTTCDLSDWEASALSVQPFASDTIQAPTFAVYSRYGRYQNDANQDDRPCNSVTNINEERPPPPTKLQQLVLSEDGN